MSWFKSKEEKERKAAARKEAELAERAAAEKIHSESQLEQEYDGILAKVKFTPESKEAYQARTGQILRVIDTETTDLGVVFINGKLWGDFKLKQRLVEGGIELLVNTNYSYSNSTTYGGSISSKDCYYGLPVAIQKGSPYRTPGK